MKRAAFALGAIGAVLLAMEFGGIFLPALRSPAMLLAAAVLTTVVIRGITPLLRAR